MIQRRVWVSGRVQGVGFRASTAVEAKAYRDLRGWVRNLGDGRVEALFQGGAKDVLAMIDWCRRGPRNAQVTNLSVREEEVDPTLKPFRVEHE